MAEKILPKDRISASFKQLATASPDLAEAVRELGVPVVSVENALRSLNLGVPAWHEIAGGEDPDGSYWSRDIDFSRANSKWRIVLRLANGDHNCDQHDEEIWPFMDAPRWMCVEAAGKLPDLIEDLINRTVDTTKKIKARIPATEELASAVRGVRGELASTQKVKAVQK